MESLGAIAKVLCGQPIDAKSATRFQTIVDEVGRRFTAHFAEHTRPDIPFVDLVELEYWDLIDQCVSGLSPNQRTRLADLSSRDLASLSERRWQFGWS